MFRFFCSLLHRCQQHTHTYIIKNLHNKQKKESMIRNTMVGLARLDLPNFSSHKTAHGKKSVFALIRTAMVMQSMKIGLLAKNSLKIIKLSESIIGRTLTYAAIECSYFPIYCAGKHFEEVKASVNKLAKDRIGAILDYAAEAEEGSEDNLECSRLSELALKSNVEYKMPTHQFDENMALNILCVSNTLIMLPKGFGDGFAAVKLTGLTEPLLLARVSALQLALRQAWVGFFHETLPPLEECRVVIGTKLNDRYQDIAAVREGMRKRRQKAALPAMTQAQEDAIFKLLDPASSGNVDYLTYVHHTTEALLNPTCKAAAVLSPYMQSLPSMSTKEIELWGQLERRVGTILNVAVQLGVKVMVDAEQSYFQMAIDNLVRANQRKYNIKGPVIYNTYQCYFSYGQQRLLNDIARAESEGWIPAMKLVRGAYITRERMAALANGYKSLVWDTVEETHKCYNSVADHMLSLIEKNPSVKYGIVFATHNPESIMQVTSRMQSLPDNESRIAFAQLFGMADHLTAGLAAAKYDVFKYLPYGPIRETILYLGRRAEENHAVLSGARPEEFNLLMKELLQRPSLYVLIFLIYFFCNTLYSAVTAKCTTQKNDATTNKSQ